MEEKVYRTLTFIETSTFIDKLGDEPAHIIL